MSKCKLLVNPYLLSTFHKFHNLTIEDKIKNVDQRIEENTITIIKETIIIKENQNNPATSMIIVILFFFTLLVIHSNIYNISNFLFSLRN